MTAVEGQYAALEKKLEDLPAALEEKLTEIVKGLAEQQLTEKFGDLEKKLESQSEVLAGFAELFELMRPTLGLPAIEKPVEDLTNKGGES